MRSGTTPAGGPGVPSQYNRGRKGSTKVFVILTVLVVIPATLLAASTRWDRLWKGNKSEYATIAADEGDVALFVSEFGTLDSANNTKVLCKVQALTGAVGGAQGAQAKGGVTGGAQQAGGGTANAAAGQAGAGGAQAAGGAAGATAAAPRHPSQKPRSRASQAFVRSVQSRTARAQFPKPRPPLRRLQVRRLSKAPHPAAARAGVAAEAAVAAEVEEAWPAVAEEAVAELVAAEEVEAAEAVAVAVEEAGEAVDPRLKAPPRRIPSPQSAVLPI